jgi:hypothetical protein
MIMPIEPEFDESIFPFILERGNRIYFVESGTRSERRIVDLTQVICIQFAKTIQYSSPDEVFTVRLQYEGNKYFVFTEENACALYDYYMMTRS